MSAIDREALLNALHDCIDGDILIDGEGERYAISASGAADVTRWAADALGPLIDAARAETLRAAADAWQWGEWANAPRCPDRIEERVANAQFVTDWLRARAAALTSAAPDE